MGRRSRSSSPCFKVVVTLQQHPTESALTSAHDQAGEHNLTIVIPPACTHLDHWIVSFFINLNLNFKWLHVPQVWTIAVFRHSLPMRETAIVQRWGACEHLR